MPEEEKSFNPQNDSLPLPAPRMKACPRCSGYIVYLPKLKAWYCPRCKYKDRRRNTK